MQHLTKRAAHGIHLFLVHRAEEREREAGIAGRLGHREVTPPKAELLAVEGLEVDGGEVGPGRDTAALQLSDHLVAVVPGLEAHDVHEPAHPRRPGRLDQEPDPLGVFQPCAVPRRDPLTLGKQLVEPVDLHRTQGGAQLVEAIVVAEAAVGEPPVEDVSPLVTEAAEECVPLRLARDDHAAFTRGHLLVGVEGEHPRVPQRAHRAMLVGGTDCFARILDHGEIVAARDLQDRVHVGWLSEDMDGEDGLHARAECESSALQRLRVDGERIRVDVDEDGTGARVEHAIGRGDEAERRGEHEVAVADAGSDHAEVEAGGTTADADRVGGADVLADAALQEFQAGAEREGWRVKDAEDGLTFGHRYVGLAHGDPHRLV